jgi:hypothetical protein
VVGERQSLSDDIADNEFFDDSNTAMGGKQYRMGENIGLQDSPLLSSQKPPNHSGRGLSQASQLTST